MSDTKTTTTDRSIVKTISGHEIHILGLAWSGFWIVMLLVVFLLRRPRYIPTGLVMLGAAILLTVGPINSAWKHPYYRIAFGALLVVPGLYAIAATGYHISVVLIVLGGALIVGTEMAALRQDD
jgi:hypothetical protein